MSEKQKIAQRVRILRARRHWTQQELADEMGYDRNYISMVEGGRAPGPKFEKRLALLESSPIGEKLTTEQALLVAEEIDSSAKKQRRTKEPAKVPSKHELLRKALYIEEHGSPEQIEMLHTILDAALRKVGARTTEDPPEYGGDAVSREEETDPPPPGGSKKIGFQKKGAPFLAAGSLRTRTT